MAYGDGGPLVPGTAEEGWMVLLEEVVAVLTRKKTSDLINKAGEAGNAKARERERARRVGSQKLDATLLGMTLQ